MTNNLSIYSLKSKRAFKYNTYNNLECSKKISSLLTSNSDTVIKNYHLQAAQGKTL